MSNAVVFDMAPWQPCQTNNWRCMQAKRAFEIVLGKMLQPSSRDQNDEEVPYLKALHVQWGKVILENLPTMWASPLDVEHLALKVGDLLVCEGGEVGRAAPLSEQPPDHCIIQNALHRVRNLPLGEVKFLSYILNHAAEKGWFNVLCNRATIAHFTVEKFRDLWMHLPSPISQQLIANYLDKETSQIDILIKEKERMLLLLEEKRAALISHAVTHGLDPNTPLKASGYSWLGDIPAHWQVRRCASLFKEVDERNQPDLPLLNVSLNTGVTLRIFSDNKIESVAADFASYKVARKGNLAFNKMRFWQGAVGVAPEDGLTSPDYTVAEFGPELNADYVEFLFRIPQFIMEVRRHSHGIVDDRLRLYWNGFKNICIPVPPLFEQKAIAEHLLNERLQAAEMEDALNKSIQLLKERRSSLITAAVTGRINLSGEEL